MVRSLDYSHPSLREQLELGLLGLELDIFHDPEGGRYAEPGGIAWVRGAGQVEGAPFDAAGEMLQPGFKVLHVQDLDFRSNCLTLRSCLQQLRRWSSENSGHLPVTVTMNAKDQAIERDGFVRPLPFDAAAWDALDREIVEVLGRERLLVPDDVRREHESLEAAVLSDGWPPLEDVRGKFLFVLDERGEKQRGYVQGHPSLRERVLFVNAEPGRPEAAFLILNDPLGQAAVIRHRVLDGYLVRTRADADTEEARSGETLRREAAFASGAQLISTDYYRPDPRFATGYQATLPGGGVVRCNPVTVSADCRIE